MLWPEPLWLSGRRILTSIVENWEVSHLQTPWVTKAIQKVNNAVPASVPVARAVIPTRYLAVIPSERSDEGPLLNHRTLAIASRRTTSLWICHAPLRMVIPSERSDVGSAFVPSAPLETH